MASLFSRIVAGEVPCHKVAETRDFLAFLDINPVRPGHTLVIPKKEVDVYFDLDDETFIGLNLFAKAVAEALKKATGAPRICTSVIGFEVPHAHIHLIPASSMADLNFLAERPKPGNEELAAMALAIRSKL